MTQGVKRTPPSLWYQAKEHLRYLVAMKGNLARSGHYSRANTPAGQRQSVLGVDAFALYTRTKAGDVTSRYRTSQSESSMYHIQATNTPICTMLGGPPPLPPVVPIPLPPLSPTIPVQTHPLITYRLHHSNVNSPILWNISLPPSTARRAAQQRAKLAMVARSSCTAQRLAEHDDPRSRHPSPHRRVPNVVVASDAGDSNTTHLIFRPGPDDGNQEVGSINAVPSDAIHRQFRGRVWWAGLRASTDEVDVWILQLQGRRRGGRH